MNLIFYKLAIFFYVLNAVLSLACNGTCTPDQVLDCIKCQCIPKLNCSTQPADSANCDQIDCSNPNATLCPNKCYCMRPSVLNNYCPSCLNGGMRNFSSSSCQCICPFGYLGDRCQFAANPCLVDDTPDCSSIDCYSASEEMFYKCQRKCLCCSNEKCFNLGLLSSTNSSQFIDYCTCNCINSNYSLNDNCLTPLSCVDDKYCSIQFGVYPSNPRNCIYSFVKALCPLSCGLCNNFGK